MLNQRRRIWADVLQMLFKCLLGCSPLIWLNLLFFNSIFITGDFAYTGSSYSNTDAQESAGPSV